MDFFSTYPTDINASSLLEALMHPSLKNIPSLRIKWRKKQPQSLKTSQLEGTTRRKNRNECNKIKTYQLPKQKFIILLVSEIHVHYMEFQWRKVIRYKYRTFSAHLYLNMSLPIFIRKNNKQKPTEVDHHFLQSHHSQTRSIYDQ